MTPRSDLYYLGTFYPITSTISVDAEAYHLRFQNSQNKAWMFAGRGAYAFSKRTSVYATAGFIDNLGNLALSVNSGRAAANPAPVGNQFGAMVGVKHIL